MDTIQLLATIERLESENAELKAKLIAGPDKVLRCAFCGHEYPEGTPASKSDALRDHVRRCREHPLFQEFVAFLEEQCNRRKIDTGWGSSDDPITCLVGRIRSYDLAFDMLS